MDTSTMWLRGPRGESRGVSWDRHLDIDCVANMRDIGAEDDAALIATVLEITRVAGDALFDGAGRGVARVSNGVLVWGVGGENLADVLLPPVTVYEPEIDI